METLYLSDETNSAGVVEKLARNTFDKGNSPEQVRVVINNLAGKHKARLAEWEKRLTDLDEKQKNHKAALEELAATLQDRETLLNELKTTLDAREAALEDREQSVASREAELAELESTLATKAADLLEVEASLVTQKETLDALDAKLTKQMQQLEAELANNNHPEDDVQEMQVEPNGDLPLAGDLPEDSVVA
jgi:chromosome segregation ATPase